jgi:DNA-binding transcriptional LysR family regulator
MQWSERELAPPANGLADIEFRHLAALTAVGQEQSFRGAADSLGYVQSAVSHQIAALERCVGTRLVDRQRGNRPVSLTPAGALLVEHSEKILREVSTAHERLLAIAEGRASTLRVGAFQSVAVHIIPRVRGALARGCPEFRLAVTETRTDEPLFELLRDGELDLIFCEEPVLDGPFERVYVTEDPFVLVLPEDSGLARREEPPTLDEIGGLPMIGFRAVRGQDVVLEALAERGITPRYTVKLDLNPTVAPLVAAGLGVAIVPYLTVDAGHPGTTVVELHELPPRKIAVAWRSDDPPSAAANQFIEAACAATPRFRRSEPADRGARSR